MRRRAEAGAQEIQAQAEWKHNLTWRTATKTSQFMMFYLLCLHSVLFLVNL